MTEWVTLQEALFEAHPKRTESLALSLKPQTPSPKTWVLNP